MGEDGMTIVNGKLDTVEVSNKDRRDGRGKVRAEGGEKGGSVSTDRGGMKMDKTQAAHCDKLDVSREDFLNGCEGEAGEDGQDEVTPSTM